MDQPVATYTEDDFERVLAREFPAEDRTHILGVLSQYGAQHWQTASLRVQMACLKLARGNLAKLQEYVAIACKDPRDVLSWAEYSNYGRARGDEQRARAIATDWSELQEWLHRR